MTEVRASPRGKPNAAGALLQSWRRARHLSQLSLATEADVSPRHLSFVETGRANASREMIFRLSRILDIPLRERNALLLAAGYAPVYAESPLHAPALAAVRNALEAILRQQEPYPAVVLNRSWDVLSTNEAASRFFGFLLGERVAPGPANVLRMMFDPGAVRPFVANWEAVAEALVQRVHRESLGGVLDDAMRKMLGELLDYPGVPASLRHADPTVPLLPVIPVSFAKDGHRFDFFSTVTTLGTPQDITVQEIRIECFFPADAATAQAASALARPL